MGASREGTEPEKALNRCISEIRSLDKLLWSASGSPTQAKVIQLRHLEENIQDFESAWHEFKEQLKKEIEL